MCFSKFKFYFNYLPYIDARAGFGRYFMPETRPMAANMEKSEEPP